MKPKLLFIAMAFATFSSYGQSLEFTDKVLDKLVLDVNLEGSDMVTKELHQELDLTQEQYRRVEQVNKMRFQQILNAEQRFAKDPVLLRRTFNDINSKSDKALSSVLSEEQMSRYLKLAEKKEKLSYSINQVE